MEVKAKLNSDGFYSLWLNGVHQGDDFTLEDVVAGAECYGGSDKE